jgi:hypothetical protein
MTLRRDTTGGLFRLEPTTEKLAGHWLNPGDFVIHQSYGVGRFEGIEAVEREGHTLEYSVIAFADDKRVYVPTDAPSLQPYGGPESPNLSQIDETKLEGGPILLWREIRDARDSLAPQGGWLFRAKGCRWSQGNVFSDTAHAVAREEQQRRGVKLGSDGNERSWWWFKDEFYWEDEGLTSEEVAALVLDGKRRREARIKRAMTSYQQVEEEPGTSRAAISDDVKVFVWRRDEGKCVRCGSQANLEFDHIIPLTMGGSNTARNLQILCEPCNRAKGGNLV